MAENQSPGPTNAVVDERLAAWSQAEREGDIAALEALLHQDFVGVGPYGYLLDREQWLARFDNGLRYDAFEFTPMGQPRVAGGASIIIGTQTQQGAYNDRPADGVFRTSLVLVGTGASIAHLQISLGSPPGMPS